MNQEQETARQRALKAAVCCAERPVTLKECREMGCPYAGQEEDCLFTLALDTKDALSYQEPEPVTAPERREIVETVREIAKYLEDTARSGGIFDLPEMAEKKALYLKDAATLRKAAGMLEGVRTG